MPTYTFRCKNGHQFERYLRVADLDETQMCLCDAVCELIITPPVLVAAQPECRYDSPITGEPITTWAQRRNDLAKHGCRPYDPEMKTDFLRQQQEREAAIDHAVEATVEESIAKMPTKKRGELHTELTEQGYDLSLVRKTGGG